MSPSDVAVIRDFLAGAISLGKVAEFELPQLNVMERLRCLDVPLGPGRSSLEGALEELSRAASFKAFPSADMTLLCSLPKSR